jgi:hypothetical protein
MITNDQDESQCSDRSFPYALIYGTAGTIIGLIAVWISMSLSFAAPVLGA